MKLAKLALREPTTKFSARAPGPEKERWSRTRLGQSCHDQDSLSRFFKETWNCTDDSSSKTHKT